MADVILKNITKHHGDCRVIDNLSLDIRGGEFVTLLGPSGCGKTTLLRMVAGLTSVEQGELWIGGALYNDIPAQRRRIAMVFQSYALFPHMSVKDNVLFGLRIRKAPPHEMFDKLSWVMPLLGLEGLESRLPKEISGGQRQRAALARALVLDPEVLLLDEPLSNLDAALREMAMEELKRIHQQVGKTILYVTHNQAEAMSMSQRIAVMKAGRIEHFDTPRVVYDHPHTVFTAQFIGSPVINMLEGEIERGDGVIGAKTGLGFFVLDRDRGAQAGAMIGRRVRVGIRPQNVLFAPHSAARRASDTRIEVTAELVETLGDRSLVIARADDGTMIRFMITRDESIPAGTRVAALVDGRRIHLFEPATGINVFAGDKQ
ncbi:MAG: ATP-binding cassette domain-containing protein [Chitinivibrionales bacterium]|nr:ATP-binding cassette domain-containing protein [Chitinivibrionales bacterium]MBD3395702.1 ATP-binding cassette domain-containing protein [Chitinivibrionales bacterium]